MQSWKYAGLYTTSQKGPEGYLSHPEWNRGWAEDQIGENFNFPF